LEEVLLRYKRALSAYNFKHHKLIPKVTKFLRVRTIEGVETP
jgi:hypothetical protein